MLNKYKKIIISIIITLIVINIILITPLGKTLTVYTINATNGVTGFITNTYNNISGYFINNYNSNKEKELTQQANNSLENQLKDQESNNAQLTSENEALKQQLSGNQELLNSIFSYNQNAKIINGQIVNRNINQWNNTATINVGSKDGAIAEGQAIVNNGYLIGFVSKVNESTSEIQLLTIENKQLNTPLMAVSGNQEINSILVGYDVSKNEYSMKVLDQSKRLNVGDRVLTNGYQSGVAKGIRLGTISNLEVNNDTGEIIYKIKLPTSITDARYIGVVVNG